MPSNPVGTVQSIEHTLRNLDKLAAEQQNRVARIEKELADYQAQADRPFEHEERLKQLLARQAELNSLLDLDKGDQQGAGPAPEKDEPEAEHSAAVPLQGHEEVANRAAEYMRASDTAIRELPISERTPPRTGSITGTAVGKRFERTSRWRQPRTASSSCHRVLWVTTYRSVSVCLCACTMAAWRGP